MKGAAAHTDLSDKLLWTYLRHVTEHLTTFKLAQTTITKTIPFPDHSIFTDYVPSKVSKMGKIIYININ